MEVESHPARLPIQALTPAALAEAAAPLTVDEARRVISAVVRWGWSPTAPLAAQPRIMNVRRAALAAVRAVCTRPTLARLVERASALDPFVKLLLETADGERIETVRIPLEKPGRFSVCVSSQVGCALACSFCATGRLGLRRNLEAWEIVEQVHLVRGTLDLAAGQRVHGVVFQGMGEPLANLDRVLAAIEVLSEPSGLAVEAKAITVCTAGLPSGIRRLAREAPKVRLGLSIGSALAATRRRLMPIEGAHPLDEVLEAVAEHARATGLAPMWAITPLAGVNDSAAEAAALAALVHRFIAAAGVRPRLSLIPYNPIAADGTDPYARLGEGDEGAFRDALRAAGVFTHKRYSGGADVGAACGQLAGRD